jgi:hypothetical protein
MDNRERDAVIATQVMGWKLFNYETCEYDPDAWTAEKAQNNDGWAWDGRDGSLEAWEWNPSESPADSKQLREKLAEKWDYTLGRANNFAMALWPKGTIDKYAQPTHLGVADTEELAIAECALKLTAKEAK